VVQLKFVKLNSKKADKSKPLMIRDGKIKEGEIDFKY
jgi:hypothetical protein